VLQSNYKVFCGEKLGLDHVVPL